MKSLKIAVFAIMIIFYLFFTIAATKMPLFCIPLAPMVFLALGAMFEKLISLPMITKKFSAAFSILILSITGFFYLDIKTLEEKHSDHNPKNDTYRAIRLHNATIAKRAAQILPSKDYVVFNCRSLNSILVMFYAANTAYDKYPDENTYKDLKNKGLKLAVFTNDKLPDYLSKDNEVFKMNMQMISY